MARVRRPEKARAARKSLTVSHREWLVSELRADPKLAAAYLSEAAEDGDPRVYLAALRTVAEAKGMAKLAKAAGLPRESLYRAFVERQSALFRGSKGFWKKGFVAEREGFEPPVP